MKLTLFQFLKILVYLHRSDLLLNKKRKKNMHLLTGRKTGQFQAVCQGCQTGSFWRPSQQLGSCLDVGCKDWRSHLVDVLRCCDDTGLDELSQDFSISVLRYPTIDATV